MIDHVSTERRSAMMSAVRGKNTRPEMLVRSAAHRLGLRFRLHAADLPGRPDLVFRKIRTAIFVNGCFWHRHHGCRKASMPKSNRRFWANKFRENVRRDKANYAKLEALGWRVIIVWQCEVRTLDEASGVIKNRFKRYFRERSSA